MLEKIEVGEGLVEFARVRLAGFRQFDGLLQHHLFEQADFGDVLPKNLVFFRRIVEFLRNQLGVSFEGVFVGHATVRQIERHDLNDGFVFVVQDDLVVGLLLIQRHAGVFPGKGKPFVLADAGLRRDVPCRQGAKDGEPPRPSDGRRSAEERESKR